MLIILGPSPRLTDLVDPTETTTTIIIIILGLSVCGGGGHLIFLILAGADRFWIGLSDHATEGQYRWDATGGLLTWSNWCTNSNQPNDGGRGQDYIYAHMLCNMKWFDMKCEPIWEIAVLCEYLPWI